MRFGYTLIIVLFFIPGAVFAQEDPVREAALGLAKGEAVMVDGPFYLADAPYYVADYMYLSDTKGVLVFDPEGSPITDPEIMRKVLAVKDLKNLLFMDPLFYAVGDSSKISYAARFETASVRNFAVFSSISSQERTALEIYLLDYEKTMDSVSACSMIINDMLYPEGDYSFEYSTQSPNIRVDVKGTPTRYYSYEGFERLQVAYEQVYQDYGQLVDDLEIFAGLLEDYPPGATIREKWEVRVTKEGILEEIRFAGENGLRLDDEVSMRRDILEYPYSSQIDGGRERLGLSPSRDGSRGICGPTLVLLIGTFAGLAWRARRPGTIFLALLVFSGFFSYPGLSLGESGYVIPSAEDLISRKVTDTSAVEIDNQAEGLDDELASELVADFRLYLKGEDITILGPYYYYGEPNYIFQITSDGTPTGDLFMVDGTNFRLIGDQRRAFQVQKARSLADLLGDRELYADVDHGALKKEADSIDEAPLHEFMVNLTENVESGKVLEASLIEKPDFETLHTLTENYIRGYILLTNIARLKSETEAIEITQGFYNQVHWLDAYSRVMRGPTADEFFEARRSQYRGRTLNRIPLMAQISAMGMRPSKAQVVHDLTSDLLYDNLFIWRQGKTSDPNLFARLAFKEGTFTYPEGVEFNETAE